MKKMTDAKRRKLMAPVIEKPDADCTPMEQTYRWVCSMLGILFWGDAEIRASLIAAIGYERFRALELDVERARDDIAKRHLSL